MTICPIAIAVGCQKCPVFKICPLKRLIGDQPPAVQPEVKAKPVAMPGDRLKARPKAKAKARAKAKPGAKPRVPTARKKPPVQ